jgi:hypothetical protein
MEKTCLHRFCGDCKDCKVDYEPISPIHPFNNYSCKKYYEIHCITQEIEEIGLRDEIFITIIQAIWGKKSLEKKLK